MFTEDLDDAFRDPETKREERKVHQFSKFVIVAGDSSDDSSFEMNSSDDSLNSPKHNY